MNSRTTKSEGPGALTIIQMSHPEIHTCSAGKLAPLQQCIDAKVSYAVGKKDEGRFGCCGRRFGMGDVYWNIV